MSKETNKIPSNVVAGIFFAFSALINLMNINPYNRILTVGFVILTAAAFANKKSFWLWIGVTIAAAGHLYNFFSGLMAEYHEDSYFRYALFMSPAFIFLIPVTVLGLSKNEKKQKAAKRLRIITVILFLLSIIAVTCFDMLDAAGDIDSDSLVLIFKNLSAPLICGTAFIAFMDWLLSGDNERQAKQKKPESPPEWGYFDILNHVLLLIFTFGIWRYIWIYYTTSFLNTAEEKAPRNPTKKLLLCMFVPFYYIYWTYKSAKLTDKAANELNISSDITLTSLLLAIFVPDIAPILIQDKINAVAGAKNEYEEVLKA